MIANPFSNLYFSIVFNTLFGLSVKYWMAIATRFLLGALNGFLAPVKAYSIEVCQPEQQALGTYINCRFQNAHHGSWHHHNLDRTRSPTSGPHDHRSLAATPAPATTHRSPLSNLSPQAKPFYPGAASGGRGKHVRWRDDSDSDAASPCASPPRPSYRDVLLHTPSPVSSPANGCAVSSPPAVSLSPPRRHEKVTDRLGTQTGERHGRRPQRRRGQTTLLHGLPPRRSEHVKRQGWLQSVLAQPAAAPAPNTDEEGWTTAESRRTRSRRRRRQRLAQRQWTAVEQAQPPVKRIPLELAGRCFNSCRSPI
uniref:Major facilitator superfamily (MFS) profile domain-containing protein n=1 Tax=Setaria viridis TaxID=4556 RepID=A0A4U6TNR9_SETVI|nr:uncharacterized protein LOC117866726 isoform X2 [Setaria viridis]XP_034606894.1 uncharacterized protein LOC117866726 isoform X2 [Setaria viridis]XP_034606896.1 uncharacterized protein LOC117866726 isoform X2 [Setaria viridis]TKV99124.1 hypothetical protein SEVIR_8G023100v2 [Setaria viridis]TKV99125.1 hypothetical protein SEVIR_8G023100v2 [Setaria viridis]TKV99126.1 hypothetical protein SEVIR_8G023100v2 [Setaria viridis]